MTLPKVRNRVVVGVLVDSQIAVGSRVVGGPFDFPRTGLARGIGRQQPARHHRRMIGAFAASILAFVLGIEGGSR